MKKKFNFDLRIKRCKETKEELFTVKEETVLHSIHRLKNIEAESREEALKKAGELFYEGSKLTGLDKEFHPYSMFEWDFERKMAIDELNKEDYGTFDFVDSEEESSGLSTYKVTYVVHDPENRDKVFQELLEKETEEKFGLDMEKRIYFLEGEFFGRFYVQVI